MCAFFLSLSVKYKVIIAFIFKRSIITDHIILKEADIRWKNGKNGFRELHYLAVSML